MYCSHCGTQLGETSAFCQHCGQAVGSSVQTRFAYAGFWIRFAAYLLDELILGIPFLVVMTAAFFLFGGFRLMVRRSLEGPPGASFIGMMIGVYVVAFLFYFVVRWLYYALMESSPRQATFGKSLVSLSVCDVSGRPLSFGHATGRYFAKIVSGMIPFGIGFIIAGFTEKKQAIHDMIAGTMVLQK
jgi:uncharacterized RDD family membrane protein YckC